MTFYPFVTVFVSQVTLPSPETSGYLEISSPDEIETLPTLNPTPGIEPTRSRRSK